MARIALWVLLCGLLAGAAPCSDEADEGGTGSQEGGGSAGTGDDGTEPGDTAGGSREPCGPNTCATGEVCCNESCGICTAPGGFCTEQFCEDPGSSGTPGDEPGQDPSDPGSSDPGDPGEPGGGEGGGSSDPGTGGGDRVACGNVTCAAGEVCCNESCGICTAPGAGCTKQLCNDSEPPPRCGGFAGFTCPGFGECIDDPSDDCDPENGGADCGGLCTCPPGAGAAVLCAQDSPWSSDPNVCGCDSSAGGGTVGETCGKNVCPSGQTCCNASCGICAPPDGACIQIACL
jgi:hypothetical protein